MEALASDQGSKAKLPLLGDENHLALASGASRLGIRWLEFLGILDACRVSSDRDVAMEGRALVGRGASRVVALSDGNHRLGEAWCRASRAPHEERVGGEHVLRDGGQVVRDQWQWLEARAPPHRSWRGGRSGGDGRRSRTCTTLHDVQHGASDCDQLMILQLYALAQDGLLCHGQSDIGMSCEQDLELADCRVPAREWDHEQRAAVLDIAEEHATHGRRRTETRDGTPVSTHRYLDSTSSPPKEVTLPRSRSRSRLEAREREGERGGKQ